MTQKRLRIGVLYSRVRVEEKWIFGAMEKLGIDYERLDDRAISFDLEHPEPWQAFDAVLERSISYTSGLYSLRMLDAFGVRTVNTARVAEICGDKLVTSAMLSRAGVPQPHTVDGFHPRSRTGRHRGVWIPGGTQTGGRLMGQTAGQDQRP